MANKNQNSAAKDAAKEQSLRIVFEYLKGKDEKRVCDDFVPAKSFYCPLVRANAFAITLQMGKRGVTFLLVGDVVSSDGFGAWLKAQQYTVDLGDAGKAEPRGENEKEPKNGIGNVFYYYTNVAWDKVNEGNNKASIYNVYMKVIHSLEAVNAFTLPRPKNRNSKALRRNEGLRSNLIVFGAPGTGKSHYLEGLRGKKKKEVIEGNDSDEDFFKSFERVTFYPTYSYAQFVGTYKPVMDDKNEIAYKFVPGPFLNLLARALKDPEHNYLIIIEEINRANAAAVFGDMFQLLDRDDDGMSEYGIAVPEDVKKWLDNQKVKVSHTDGPDAQERTIAWDGTTLYIPPNFYIWATMNSADQGVFPLDTAFKRRWEFEYIGVDGAGPNIWIETGSGAYSWAALRQAINAKLLTAGKVNEDKLLGPWFLKGESGDYISAKKFSSKVLMYLWEDAARMCRKQFFADEITMFSDLKRKWESAHGLPDANESTFSEVFQIQKVKNLRFKGKVLDKDLEITQGKNEDGTPLVKDDKPVFKVKFKGTSLEDKTFKIESVEGNPSLAEIIIDSDICYGRIRFNIETCKVEAAQNTTIGTQAAEVEEILETPEVSQKKEEEEKPN